MIKLENLCCGYENKDVIKDLSAVFNDGEVTAIIGPNGAGKSTLIESVIGLIKPESGNIFIDGDSMDSLTSTERARRVAYMSQNRNIPQIVAKKLVLHGRFPHLSYPRKYRKEDYEITMNAMKAVGAADLAEFPVMNMSGGQRQKIYLAMALAQDTKTIFMDEPTNFLDVYNQIELMSLAKRLADEGKAIVMVIHDIRMALEYVDRIIILKDGKVEVSGTPDEVFESQKLDSVFNVKLCRFMSESGKWKYYYG